VVVELAGARSNSETAARPCGTEATVAVQVSRILATLGLRDRAQVVVFAHENGVVSPGE
jgi:DNA-binding NarL/FixJ family response regulator